MTVLKLEVGYLSENFEMEGSGNRFRKEIIRAGTYYHPDAPGGTLEVTVDRMQMWADNFREAGIKVWVPYRHSKNPKENTGWVEDILIEDQSLFAVLTITDENAAQMLRDGTIQDVSIGIDFDFVDDRGRHFAEVIRHIALTVDPHIREQGPFDEVRSVSTVTGGSSGRPETSEKAKLQAEPEDEKNEIILEQRNNELNAENLDLKKQLNELRFRAEDNVRREDHELVERFISDGLLTPACREEARALLSARTEFIEMEEGISSVHNTFRSMVEKFPSRIGYGQIFKLEPPRPGLTEDEEGVLAKLGLTSDDISRYSNK